MNYVKALGEFETQSMVDTRENKENAKRTMQAFKYL